jgi:aspartyl-tRNA(Asn)/glutamyl-tRNA(Gln) amidotransferase subunit B
MNSMRNVMRAIEFEAKRQVDIIEEGGVIEQQTRSFNANDGSTFMLRSKENANDYRYFPEPDLPPFIVSDAKVQEIRDLMPKLSKELFKVFTKDLGLSAYDANIISDDKYVAAYYKDIIAFTSNYKAAANWLIGPIKSYLNDQAVEIVDFPIAPEVIASIVKLIEEGKLNFASASNTLFPALLAKPDSAVLQLAESLNIIQNSDSGAIEKIVEQVLAEHADKVAAYRAGKVGLMGMFMGQVMKKSGGKADPKIATALLTEKLK